MCLSNTKMIFLFFISIFLVTQKCCFCTPTSTDSLMKDIREIKESVFHLNNVLEQVLSKINKVEDDTENLKKTFEKKDYQNCSKSKEMNESIIIAKKTQEESLEALLVLSNSVDYTFCNFVKNFSGIFRFSTSATNLIDETRDYGIRLCQEGWLVIQKRDTFDYQQNFNRSWNDYKRGFGDLRTEFWFGNHFLHRLSHQNDLKLRIEVETFDGNKTWAEYETFKIGNEHENYRLEIGGYNGTASDSFSYHNNAKFCTRDKHNYDVGSEAYSHPSAVYSGSGWWFNQYFTTNLNGIYYKKDTPPESTYEGIIWNGQLGDSMKSTKMMVKAKASFTQLSDLTYKIIQ